MSCDRALRTKGNAMRRLGEAEEIMGRSPINPLGSCFLSAFASFVSHDHVDERAKLCHGVCTANMPGEEGLVIGHAWIEIDGVAFDAIWGVAVERENYRNQLKAKHVAEYSISETIKLWDATQSVGPWDKNVLNVTIASGRSREI